jgi:26S proteasome regulatory subunit T5
MVNKLVKTPYLIASLVEILDVKDEEDPLNKITGESAVVKLTGHQTIFLPSIGLVPANDLKPSDIVAVNRDTYIIYEKMPANYDPRVKAMELDTKPTDTYADCGGLEKQIQQLHEAIEIPLMEPERLRRIGICPPKGVLLFGPPGTGKTMLARACANATKATFLRLAGTELVQQYLGEGAALVREAFDLARQKKPTVIFIDEIDAVGGKRGGDSDRDGGREVSRTMLELLNQLDGFTELDDVKVICATNRPDILDPALVRSGRLDRKIELPLPNEENRISILGIHSRDMKVDPGVNLREIARSTEDFNGAMLMAICIEAGMSALRRGGEVVIHEDYVEGIAAVQAKKKNFLNYFT